MIILIVTILFLCLQSTFIPEIWKPKTSKQGIFNKTEYEKLFAMKDVSTRRPVVFTPDSQPQGWSSDRTVADYVVENNPNSTAAGSKSNESDESIELFLENWEKSADYFLAQLNEYCCVFNLYNCCVINVNCS